MVFYFEDISAPKPGHNISQLIKQEKITFGKFEYSEDIQLECARYTSEKFLIPRVFISVDSFYYIYYHCIKNINGTTISSETRIEAFKNYTKKNNLQYNELILKQFRKDFKAKKQPKDINDIETKKNNINNIDNNINETTNKETVNTTTIITGNESNDTPGPTIQEEQQQQVEQQQEQKKKENSNQILKLQSQLNKKEQQEKENSNLILKLQSQLNEKEKQIKEFEQQKSTSSSNKSNLKRKREDEELEISKLYSSFTSSAQIPCVKFLLDNESVAPSFMFQMSSTNFSIKIEISKTNTTQ